jgi:hypothetical protein
MDSYREVEGSSDENPTPIWAAAQAYERAQDWGAAIQHYERAGREGYAYRGTRELEWYPESAHQSAARLRRAHPEAAGELSPPSEPSAPTTEKGVIEEVWDWVTGGGGDEPAAATSVGAATKRARTEDVRETVGAAASKFATDTARQTAAVERGPAPRVQMPARSTPSWVPYAVLGAAGLGVVAVVGYFLTRKTTPEGEED